MRIVVWNCGGAFHRKWSHLAALDPDVAVVSECCQPERVVGMGATSSAWIGRLHYKGLAVFGFGEWRVDAEEPTDDQLEWVLPARIVGPSELNLVAVWAMNRRAAAHPERFAGQTQPEAAVEAYDLSSSPVPVVVAGGFNSSPVFDRPSRPSFARTREAMNAAGLTSLYHYQSGEAFGEERTPTHWWRDRTSDGPTYHIDYVWVSDEIADSSSLRVGGYEDWVTAAGSDHAALIVDMDV